jgi:GMP synthase-like glutamine amidotransferase
MPQPWAVIRHVAWEEPGLIAAEAKARGLSLDARMMERGDPLPDAAEIGGLIVMGGSMAVYEADRFPHLKAEQALLRAAVDRGLPLLCVCLGAQLLAAALGARVFKGTAEEIGFGSVTLSEEGARDPVLGPAGPAIPVFQWHGDTFDLPDRSKLLAGNALYPNQAFKVGPRVYALQFHVELDAAVRDSWAPHLPHGIRMDAGLAEKAERAGRGIISRFFDAATREGRA